MQFTQKQIGELFQQLDTRRNDALKLKMQWSELANRLQIPRARTFAYEGVGRRMGIIQRCVNNVFEMYPPHRLDFFTHEECEDIAIHLHAFAINVYAIFDNLAWVLVLEAGLVLEPKDVCLFKKQSRPAIPQRLTRHLGNHDLREWFNNFGKPYRDSTAHRIPPYMPSREYTPDEAGQWERLDKASWDELLNGGHGEDNTARLARHAELERQKAELGHNSVLMCLSPTGEGGGPPVIMHPQLLCDWALIIELVEVTMQSIRETYGWPKPAL